MSLYDISSNLINGTLVVAIAGAIFYYFGYFYAEKGDDKNKYVYGFIFFLENICGPSLGFLIMYGFGYTNAKLRFDSNVVSLCTFLSTYISVGSVDLLSRDIGFLIFMLMNVLQFIVLIKVKEYQEILSSESDNLIKWRVRNLNGYRNKMSDYAFYCSFAVVFVGLFYGIHSDSNMFVYMISHSNGSVLSSEVEYWVTFALMWYPFFISFFDLTMIARFKGALDKVYNNRHLYEESLIGYG